MKLASATARFALRNVLLATDLSPVSESALGFARAIARRFGSKLFVTNVVSPMETVWVPPEYWASREEIEEVVRRQMQEIGSNLQDLPHELLVEHGGISEAISAEIDKMGIDLLVVGTHGREGFDRFVLGSTAEEIFRRVTCPVLTIGPGVMSQAPNEAEFKEIIFATNFGPESLAAATYAISLAQEFQARLSLLNVVSDRIDSRVDPKMIVLERINRLRALIPPDADLWCRPECVVGFGKGAEQILKVAQERNADLILLGAKSANGHTGAATHFSSATAHTVVSHASCPVMTVGGQAKTKVAEFERERRSTATPLPSLSYT
jgi:nucleotide-binding universal stress UspA family protein